MSKRGWTSAAVVTALVALFWGAMVSLPRSNEADAATRTIADSFTRKVAQGWGSASGGYAWATTGKAKTSVDGARGIVALGRGGFARSTLTGVKPVSSTMSFTVGVDRRPGGTGAFVGLSARLNSTGEYRAVVRVLPDGRVTASIRRFGKAPAIIAKERVVSGLLATPGRRISVAFSVGGTSPTRLGLSVWRAGARAPRAQIIATDSARSLQVAGGIGITSALSPLSKVGTVRLSYDAFGLVTPKASAAAPVGVAAAPPVTTTTTTTTASSCTGTQVSAGADLVAKVNAAASGSTVCIGPGRYRITGQLSPRAHVTLWGNGAVVDGSVPLTGWVASGATWYVAGKLPAAYSKTGACENNTTNPCQIAEQVFQDDVRLVRVMSLSAVKAGTFYQDFAANRVYVGSNPAGHVLAMAKTRTALASSAGYVTIKNLVFEKFASLAQRGAVLANGPSWTITGNTMRNNHGVGLLLSLSNSTVVKGNSFVNNGQLGLGVGSSQGVVISGNTITGNNRDGFWMADWESGGMKGTASSATVSGNVVRGNYGVGLWFDVDSKTVTIDGNTVSGNIADGIRVEISYNVIVRNNVVTGNGNSFGSIRGGGTSLFACAGITVNTVSGIQIYGNTVSGNINGIGLQKRDRGSGIHGLRDLVNAVVHDNNVTMTSGSAVGQGTSGLVVLGTDTSAFTSKGNKFTHNTYTLDSTSARRFAWMKAYSTLSVWKSYGNDTTGVFKLG